MKSNKIIDQEAQALLTEGSNNSTSASTIGLTSTSTCLHGWLLPYLYKTVIIILCLSYLYEGISTVVHLLLLLQMSLRVSLQKNILHHLYKGISTTIHLLLSLLRSRRCEVIQLSLRVFLPSEII